MTLSVLQCSPCSRLSHTRGCAWPYSPAGWRPVGGLLRCPAVLSNASKTARTADQEEAEEVLASQPAWLEVVHCPDRARGDRIELTPETEPLLVGRDVQPGLSLPDPKLSRLHLRVIWDSMRRGFRLGDAQSSNGTYVNGTRVQSQLLHHGDVIRCGDSLLVFECHEGMQSLLERARRFAESKLAVLILGETGVGKEVLARLVHEQSKVPGPFVPVNCATLSRDLSAAELFGHVRGAFSGASRNRDGLFVTANHGTLLLDEIGDLPLDVQPALLRVLEDATVRPVGSDRTRRTDVRVVAATHVDLDAAVERGEFRGDLLARLAQCRLVIPPLRERRSELLALAREFAAAEGLALELTPNAAEALLLWQYPFNIRELKTLVCALATDRVNAGGVDLGNLRSIDARLTDKGSFKASTRPSSGAPPPGSRRSEIAELLRLHGGNVSKVARSLDCDRAQVYRWMKSLGLSVASYRRR